MKPVIRRSLAALVFCAAVAAVTLLFIPAVLDTWVVPVLLKRISLDSENTHITQLTPFSAAGTLSLADGDTPVIAVPRFKILYSPATLIKRRIAALVIDHGAIHLHKKDGSFRLPGFPLNAPENGEERSPNPALLPFVTDTLILKQCSIILHEPGEPDLRLTVSARIAPRFSARGSTRFELESLSGTFILSDAFSASGSLSAETTVSEIILSVDLENGFPVIPNRFVPQPLVLSAPGPLSADIKLRLDRRTLALTGIDARGSLERLDVQGAGVQVEGGAANRGLSFSISGSPSKLNYSLDHLRITSPLTIDASVAGSLSMAQPAFYAKGTVEASIGADPGSNRPPLPVSLEYSSTFIPGNQWLLNFSGKPGFSEDIPVVFRRLSADIGDFRISGELHGGPDNQNADITVKADALGLTAEGTTIEVSGLELKGLLTRKDDMIMARISGTLPRIEVPGHGLFAEEIQFNLPVTLPFNESAQSGNGSLSISSIGLKDKVLASLETSFRQRGTAYDLSGTVLAAFDPDLELSLAGVAQPEKGLFELSWHLLPARVNSFTLPAQLKIPDSINFEAIIETSGTVRFSNNRLNGSMNTSLVDGYLDLPDKNISLTNINCALEIPRLPLFISSPSQLCTVEGIDIGTFKFSDAAIAYRLDDAKTLFIENSSTRWAQGSLESGSLRLSAEDREIDTTIYCNRVNFADLLNQFGFDQTEGQGALNGKLPVRISQQGLHFDDGFLFSTPGTGGIVRFSNTDLLRQGMGAVTEAGYLSYSLMALEDFSYNWTKLSFNSSGDDLLMTMQLDGKPRTALPFAFQDGMVIKTDQGNGLQYPIRLDVNFRLPLNELLQVGQSIKSIMGNK